MNILTLFGGKALDNKLWPLLYKRAELDLRLTIGVLVTPPYIMSPNQIPPPCVTSFKNVPLLFRDGYLRWKISRDAE